MLDFVLSNLSEVITIVIVFVVLLSLVLFFKSKRNRYRFSFYLNFLMYKIGLKSHISKKYVKMVHVKESYEPLVDLVAHPKIIINDMTVEKPVLLRKNVALKIYKIADKLPDNQYLKVYSAYRSRMTMYEVWKKEVDRVTNENPNMGRAEVLSVVNYNFANPFSNIGGHDTGGAIDVALCDKNGNDLDFGTKYHEKTPATRTKYSHLTAEQKKNRALLIKVMKSQDFVNLPKEWWHFSYGDSTWSAYKGKRFAAIYDAAEKDYENVGLMRIIKTNISTATPK